MTEIERKTKDKGKADEVKNKTISRSDTKEKAAKRPNREAKRSGGKVEYVFPQVPECPRCRTHDNEAYKTDGKVQYRHCRRAVCRWRWHVIGVRKKKK